MMSSSSSSGSSRPAKTALSSKVQGLKFMQRAEARKPTEQPAPSPSSSKSAHNDEEQTQSKETSSKHAQSRIKQDKQAQIIVEDGNPEHWSFASSSSAQPTRPASVDADNEESTSLGWNSWLLSTGDASRNSSKKRKSGDENGLRSASSQVTPFAGRRIFGTFPGQEEEEEEAEEEEDGDEEANESRSSSKRRQKEGPSRPRRSGSLEPDVEFDSKGQLSIREKSKKARKAEKGGSKKGRLR